MCKKLMILCLMLITSVPASAAYIGFDLYGDPNPCLNPLYIDFSGRYGNTVRCRWQEWAVAVDNGTWDSPVSKEFVNPFAEYAWENPIAELYAYRLDADPQQGGSRNRGGGMVYVGNTGDYSAGSRGFGMNYLRLTLTQLAPNTRHLISLWGYEAANVWVVNTDNPERKFGAWSTVNPKVWLEANGYDGSNPDEPPQGGYGPISPLPEGGTTDSNMPCGLLNQSYRFFMQSPVDDSDTAWFGGMDYRATVCAWSDSSGTIVLYGWIDPTDWGGSMHLPLNAILVVPEPATIALLGLGALALLRRKR
jgi:hypothetical protein